MEVIKTNMYVEPKEVLNFGGDRRPTRDERAAELKEVALKNGCRVSSRGKDFQMYFEPAIEPTVILNPKDVSGFMEPSTPTEKIQMRRKDRLEPVRLAAVVRRHNITHGVKYDEVIYIDPSGYFIHETPLDSIERL